jgi:hypothetical protein
LSFGADQSGTATLVIRATDGGALWVDNTIAVTVTPVNDAPVVVNAIPDTTVSEDGPPISAYRDLNDVFSDVEDGSALSFAIQSNTNPSLVTPTIDPSDSVLDLSFGADRNGSAAIVIRATDSGGLWLDELIVVTVVPVNDAPLVVSAIPDTLVNKDSPPIDGYRDLNDVFSDLEDGGAMAFTVSGNNNPSLVTPTIDPADSTLDMSFTAGQNGSATIAVRATDSGGLWVDEVLIVTVVGEDNAPIVVAAMPDTTVSEDHSAIANYRDLNEVFSDVEDGSALTFAVHSNSDPALVTATIGGADSTLGFDFGPNANGAATVVIRATDSGALSVDDTLIVTVIPVNDTPVVVSAVPDTTIEDDASVMNYRDLNDVFSDIEDGDTLPYTVEVNTNAGLVTAVIDPSDSTLDLIMGASQAGLSVIGVRATDSEGKWVEDLFIVWVNSVNDSPLVVSAMPDTTVDVDSPPVDDYRVLTNVFADEEDGSGLTFSVHSNSNPSLVTPMVDPTDSTLDLSFAAGENGEATLVIRATDSGALSVDDTLVVTVEGGNSWPIVMSAMPDTTVLEDSSPVANYRDLNDVFLDAEDGSALSFTVASNSNPSLLAPTINPSDSTLGLNFSADLSGSATLVIRATDSGALSVNDTLVVTVTPVNDAPLVTSAMPDTTVLEDSPPIANYRDLNDVFLDAEDGSALSFTIQSNSDRSFG